MSTASISQRELRKDSSAVLRRVEEGEALRVTRQGVPVALLMPVVEDGGLRCAKPAFHALRPVSLRRRRADTPSEMLLAGIREER